MHPLTRVSRYLTSRISFIQGLFNWMGAMALTYAIPHRREGMAPRRAETNR